MTSWEVQHWVREKSFNPESSLWAAGKCFSEMHEIMSVCSVITHSTNRTDSQLQVQCSTQVKSSCNVALQQVNLLHCIVTWAAPCVRSQSTNCYCLNRKYSSASPGESHQLLSLAFRKWAWQQWRPLIERASWKIIGKRVPSYHFSLIFSLFQVCKHNVKQSTAEWGRWKCIIISWGSSCHALGLGVLIPEEKKSGLLLTTFLESSLADLGLPESSFNALALIFSANWLMR